ncbi:MAG TPA: hypothetical protein VFZ32_11035 [Micromonosporaceae bacterium]
MSSDETRLAAVKARLYALPPEEFVEARNAEAERVPGALRRQIRALRRPTLAAWLVNLLAAHRGGELAELLGIGERLRDAQRTMEGQDLRELSTRRQAMITSLVSSLRDLAAEHGRKVRDDTVWEAETTLRAALADPELAEEVRAGTLVRSAEYSGLGLAPSDEPAAATPPVRAAPVRATPRRSRTRLRVIPGGRDAEGSTVQALPESELDTSARGRAEAALASAERELDQATTAERETGRRLAEIAAELDELRLRERRLRAEQSELERERRRAERRRQAAEQVVTEARRRLR